MDEVWGESRTEPPKKPVRVHDLKYAGLDVASKMSSLKSDLVDAGSSAIVISMLDEVAWLLNLVIFFNSFFKVKMMHVDHVSQNVLEFLLLCSCTWDFL